MMKRNILSIMVLFVLMCALPRDSQAKSGANGMVAEPILVKDINPSGNAILYQFDTTQMINLNGVLLFNANTDTGRELWKSDGTEIGTVLVKDINSNGIKSSNPTNFAITNGKLLFSANDGVNGLELWSSDGSEINTQMVANIRPGSGGSDPTFLTAAAGQVFFLADDGTNAYQLWKSNGMPGGTALVKIISPTGTSVWPYYYQTELTSVGTTLYFSNYLNSYMYNLWNSNGASEGTVMVTNTIFAGISDLTDVNGTLFFAAFDQSAGYELWKSNGTLAGTMMVKDIFPGSGGTKSSEPTRLININGTLFFAATDGVNGVQLWKSTGSEASTLMVKKINPSGDSMLYGCTTTPCPYPFQVNVNGTLFFSATDGTHGFELWKSNGTSDGTLMVKDISAGAANSNPTRLTSVCNRLFFTAGNGLWVSDGTSDGTKLVKLYTESPALLTPVGNWLFYAANDGSHGQELYKVFACEARTTFLPAMFR
jgi:ELWxxDGT repeat protein